MLEKRLRHIGQEHIARLLEQGVPFISREAIEQDLAGVDMGLVAELVQGRHLFIEPGMERVEPPEVFPASFAGTPDALPFRRQGEELLRQGKVAALIVAGGQGSRLGIEAPKGVVEVSPVRGKSLFQLHAEKIRALSARYSRTVPLFIMTSRENDAQTRAFFEKHGFFGLRPEEVFFFAQGMLPSVTPEGRLILSREGGLFLNPDGHGGTLTALKRSGCLDLMREKGIDEIFYFQVDNPLVSVCDPLFIGLHSMKGADMSSKVIRKRDFGEKVGVIATVDGRTRVIEYSDMTDEMRYAVDGQGRMRYWAGNAAIHVIRRDFVEALTGSDLRLPFHRAAKAIATLDEGGHPVEIRGVKFETFIFDALPMARASVTLEVLREHEFAPVKNMTGEDSLQSSRAMQSDLHKAWLQEAGIPVEHGCLVEISPLFALEKDDVKRQVESLPRNIVKDMYIG
ncbi:MAG TPA: UDPGP type 1 family protein [Deltaproteobacteria bacterium]|nr:UDPGP type 1 family protein [Deltaproteobacteria bacterium]HOI07970.1 UDPGP type 1 family protein [Deltaproteobacteria bacterium]